MEKSSAPLPAAAAAETATEDGRSPGLFKGTLFIPQPSSQAKNTVPNDEASLADRSLDASAKTQRTATKTTGAAGVMDASSGFATESIPSSCSSQNFATSRKVQKLLDITINDNFRELVLYMNDAVPEYLQGLLPSSDGPSASEEKNQVPQEKQPHTRRANSASTSSSMALRTALEGRVVSLHRRFLQEWSALNEVFEDVADVVSKLDQEAGVLETTLNAHAVRAEEFVSLMTNLQAELSLVQQREREINDFQKRYHFSKEEVDLLDHSPVDAAYLDVLMRAQATHRKCRELLLSREHYQSAAAMMDVTYTAIMKGTEKVARYLFSTSTASSGSATFGGDSPEITGFCLRCVHFLREENVCQWAAVVDEIARLRRAAVLRQYFHLMTTGSATTSAGTYRAGGKVNGGLSSACKGNNNINGVRPLEAEISNPIFFFGALFAWLHQVIVDEDDFFTPFFSPLPSEGETDANTEGVALSQQDIATAHNDNLIMLDEDAPLNEMNGEPAVSITKARILDSVFDVLCKHIQSVLEGVLERFLRSSSSLQDADGGITGGSGGGARPSMGSFRPMGLTGGITRLLSVATGRAMSLGSDTSGGAQRYQHVMNRSQQEALVVATLMGLTNGLRTTHTLLQLFTYYTYSTFTALLGRDAALTRLIADDAKLQLLRVYNSIAKQIVEHALDSVSSLVSGSSVLRRLASAQVMETVEGVNKQDGGVRYFVTEFLLEHSLQEEEEEERWNENVEEVMEKGVDAEAIDGNTAGLESHKQKHHEEHQDLSSSVRVGLSSVGDHNNRSNPYQRSGLSRHQAQSVDLLRRLHTMILPTPPEIEECLRVLKSTMMEAEKHAEIMEAVRTMQSKNAGMGDQVMTLTPAHHDQFFTILLQHILSFPVVLARQPTLSNTLDEPCKLILQLNTMASLQDTLDPHLGLLAHGNTTGTHTTPLPNVVPERVQQLTRQLTTSLSHCVVHHYFQRRSSSSLSLRLAYARGDEDVGGGSNIRDLLETGEKDVTDENIDADTITAQLSRFYGDVAFSGRVYIPLIGALRFPRLREQVTQGVLRSLCDMYEMRYKRLLELLPQDLQGLDAEGNALPSVSNDLDPRKLRILLDTHFSS